MAGGFCPEEYERYRIDDHIHQVFSLLASFGHHRVFYLPGVVFEHLNYLAAQGGKRIYPLNGEILGRDEQRFGASLPVRRVLAERLAQHIDGARDLRISLMEERIRRSRAPA